MKRTLHACLQTRAAAGCITVCLLTVIFGACDDGAGPVQPTSRVGASIKTFSVPKTPLEADGLTHATLSVVLVPGSTLIRPYISFATTAGVLLPGASATASVVPDGSLSASAILVAPTLPGVAFVRVDADTSTRSDSVIFVAALPDSIAVAPTSILVKANSTTMADTTVLRAVLWRMKGSVSPGARVTFVASPIAGVTPQFGAATSSDANGIVTIRFSPGLTSYSGPIAITATTAGAGGTPIVAHTTVTVIAAP